MTMPVNPLRRCWWLAWSLLLGCQHITDPSVPCVVNVRVPVLVSGVPFVLTYPITYSTCPSAAQLDEILGVGAWTMETP